MAVFSVNQNNQLYVVNSAPAKAATASSLTNASAEGALQLVAPTGADYVYFSYKGADGLLRSDMIKKRNIHYTTYKSAASLARPLKKITVTLDAAAMSGGAPIAGKDYVMHINIRQAFGMSDEDSYLKFGAVHVTTGMTATQFYTAMKNSLDKNLSKELANGNHWFDITASSSGLVITEVAQPWVLGTMAQEPVYFSVIFSEIKNGADNVKWGNAVAANASTSVPNSKNIADLEYFCMGERGDQYRNVGWPKVIPTKYMVDPTFANGYDVINIHYSYVGPNESVQQSEKDITLVAKAGTTNFAALKGVFDVAAGLAAPDDNG